MKFIKISAIWLVALATPITLAGLFENESIAKMLFSGVYGYFLMLAIGFALKLGYKPMPISNSVFWAIGLNVITCSASNSGIELMVGSMIGIIVCYQLLKLSKHIGEKPALA